MQAGAPPHVVQPGALYYPVDFKLPIDSVPGVAKDLIFSEILNIVLSLPFLVLSSDLISWYFYIDLNSFHSNYSRSCYTERHPRNSERSRQPRRLCYNKVSTRWKRHAWTACSIQRQGNSWYVSFWFCFSLRFKNIASTFPSRFSHCFPFYSFEPVHLVLLFMINSW